MSMPFLSCGSSLHVPWGTYFSVPYSCPPWFYNSYMSSFPRYLYPDYITYKEPAIGKPSPTINDHFDEKEQSMQKKKYKVIKQVYRVKKMDD